MQINDNEITLKSKRKNSKTFLNDQFSANEHRIFKSYKTSEFIFRNFCKLKFGTRMPQFIKKLETSNLSDGLKQNSIFALRNLSSFLDTINAIYINTKKIKNKDDFLNSLNVACYQFSRYADVSQKLLIFKSICKSLHKVGVGSCHMSCCDFYKVNRLLSSMHLRFNSLYRRLLGFKNSIGKKINQK